MEAALAWHCGHGDADHCRVGDLHDLRGGISLQSRTGCEWGDAEGCFGNSVFRHSLPPLKQRLHHAGRTRDRTWTHGGVSTVVERHDSAGSDLSGGHRNGVVQADRSRPPDGSHQSVWDHLLFSRRPTRIARDRGFVDDAAGDDLCADGTLARRERRASEGAGALLALCGCSVGGCLYGRVRGGEMTDSRSSIHSPDQPGALHTHSLHLPAPTAWPFLMALGLTLVFASLVTNAALAVFGGILAVVSVVGWFRDVLPHEAHEEIAVTDEIVVIVPSKEKVARIDVGETHRAQLPLETFPISSGIIGGVAGGLAR